MCLISSLIVWPSKECRHADMLCSVGSVLAPVVAAHVVGLELAFRTRCCLLVWEHTFMRRRGGEGSKRK